MSAQLIRNRAMRVNVDIHQTNLDGNYGPVEGLCLVCERCGHKVEVFGTTGASADRGAVMLREEYPKGEHNFYVTDWD